MKQFKCEVKVNFKNKERINITNNKLVKAKDKEQALEKYRRHYKKHLLNSKYFEVGNGVFLSSTILGFLIVLDEVKKKEKNLKRKTLVEKKMKDNHLYIVRNKNLLKELQYNNVKEDKNCLMVSVKVNLKKSCIKIDRFTFSEWFKRLESSKRNNLQKLAWKIIPSIRGLRRKLGLVWKISQRRLRLNHTSLQGLLAILDPKSDEYKGKLKLSGTYLSLKNDYSWGYNNTQLADNYTTSDLHIVNYLNSTGNKEKANEISDVWMKSKFKNSDRKKMFKRIRDESIKAVNKVKYYNKKELSKELVKKIK